MLKRFEKFITEKNLFKKTDKILIAVSGGIDSVAMCELFHLANSKFSIAHCNFQLRGKESDEDEKFVKNIAEKHKVNFFSAKFKTAEIAKKKRISIQMAARDLRYEWFEKIRKENGFDYISVATQFNDEIETVLINFVRGTGISGLHGILPKRDKIIRPLLFATRKEILDFAIKKNLKWRVDKSNLSDDYIRNKIRHKVIPVLKEINPNLEKTFLENIKKIRETEEIFSQRIEEKRKEIQTNFSKGEELRFSIPKLLEIFPLKTYLFEFLKPYNFNETVVEKIIASLKKTSGKKFFSETHYAVKDRRELIVKKIEKEKEEETIILENTNEIFKPIKAKFRIESDKNLIIIKNSKFAFLDYSKLKFPLVLRKWKSGDWFIPFGMKGRKKLSDFLIDKKISIPEKGNFFVLTTFEKIVWVVGHRIDERFKVSANTKKIFIAEHVIC